MAIVDISKIAVCIMKDCKSSKFYVPACPVFAGLITKLWFVIIFWKINTYQIIRFCKAEYSCIVMFQL